MNVSLGNNRRLSVDDRGAPKKNKTAKAVRSNGRLIFGMGTQQVRCAAIGVQRSKKQRRGDLV